MLVTGFSLLFANVPTRFSSGVCLKIISRDLGIKRTLIEISTSNTVGFINYILYRSLLVDLLLPVEVVSIFFWLPLFILISKCYKSIIICLKMECKEMQGKNILFLVALYCLKLSCNTFLKYLFF